MTKAYLIEVEGRWYARFRKPDGKWTHKSMRTSKKAVAQVNFSVFLKKLEEHELQFSDVVPISFGDLAEEYLKYVKSHKSRAWYENQKLYIKGPEKRPDKKSKTSILEFFGAGTLTTRITPRIIEKYAQHRRQFAKGTTVNKELACIRHMMKKAAEWNNVAVNPALKVRDLPDDSTVRERFLTPDEYQLLLKAGENGSVGNAWNLPGEPFTDAREFVVIATNTGLRRAELLHLEFSDIDWERRVLTVKRKPHLDFHPKNYQQRFVPLTDEAHDALRSLLAKKHPSSGFVFHKSDGSRWVDVSNAFQSLVRRAGLRMDPPDNVTIHTLRHTFGSWLAIAGVPMRTIQKLMGHNSIMTTERYAHLGQDNLAQAVKTIELVTNPVTTQPPARIIPRRRPANSSRISGAEGGSRTPTASRPQDPKSCASASSATSAQS
jgi:integrase